MPTVKELQEQLDKKGIEYTSRDNKAKLEALLKGSKKPAAKQRTYAQAMEAFDHVNKDNNAREATLEQQKGMEQELSTGSTQARIIVSTGTFLKIKWYRNNKVAGSYNISNYDGDLSGAKTYASNL